MNVYLYILDGFVGPFLPVLHLDQHYVMDWSQPPSLSRLRRLLSVVRAHPSKIKTPSARAQEMDKVVLYLLSNLLDAK